VSRFPLAFSGQATLFFGRQASITVARIDPLDAVVITTPLRFQFKITKQRYSPPNAADISITNLSEPTRAGMQKFGAQIEFRTGYDSDLPHLPVIFRGQARTVDHVRRGGEWVTRIQCGDGEMAYRFASVNKSWGPKTSIALIVKDIAAALKAAGVDVQGFLTNIDNGKIAFRAPIFAKGYATHGNAFDELVKLLAPKGYAPSIQNGELQVLKERGMSGRAAAFISPETGMLGSPEHAAPDKSGNPSLLKVSTLLLPKLLPGDPIIVRSNEFADATFTAEKIDHSGDSHGGDWKTDIEARPLTIPGDLAALKVPSEVFD
jgi:hypothetical protein